MQMITHDSMEKNINSNSKHLLSILSALNEYIFLEYWNKRYQA